MEKVLQNYFISTLNEQSIKKFLLDYDVKQLILNVINHEEFDDNTKCQLLSKIVNSVNFDINSYDENAHPLLLLCNDDDNLNLIKFLVEELDVDINISNDQCETSIMNAFSYGSMKIVKYLFEKGAKLSCYKNGNAKTIVNCANADFCDEYMCFFYDIMIEIQKKREEEKEEKNVRKVKDEDKVEDEIIKADNTDEEKEVTTIKIPIRKLSYITKKKLAQ